MPDRFLHIVAFDIPYPPNYGGVIDVFYKIKTLHEAGIRLILHIFEYPGRERRPELENYCEQIYYYPRLTNLRSALMPQPYIVASRRSDKLLERLSADDYPVLFEGLHSSYYLGHPALKEKLAVLRSANIEHHYYFSLFRAESNPLNKLYFLSASLKLRLFQSMARHAGLIAAISEADTKYLSEKFPGNRVEFIPAFHENNEVVSLPGKGKYILYHGNIEVPENTRAALFLAEKVFGNSGIPFVIAGMKPPPKILRLAEKYPNIRVIPNPETDQMKELVREAHVNVLVTFQPTGLKLKLLNCLYQGRYCLVNQQMLNGTGLDPVCHIANDAESLRVIAHKLFDSEFTEAEIDRRKELLMQKFDNRAVGDKLIRAIWGTN